MILDRARADVQLAGDLGVPLSGGDQAQDLTLTRGELVDAVRIRWSRHTCIRIRPRTSCAALGDSHAAPLAAARIATTTLSTSVSFARKPQAPACRIAVTSASADATVNARTRISGSVLDDPARRLDPRQARHPKVHQHHVWMELVGEPDTHLTSGCLGHDLEVALRGQE